MVDPCEITAEDFHQALMDLLPVGWAWPRDPGTTLSEFWAAVAEEFARVQGRACALLDESIPADVAELLPDYERALGLPDPCAPSNVTIDERRAAIIALLRLRGQASPASFKALALDLGYNVEVVEHRPFVCGRSRCGHQSERRPIGSPMMRHVWTVKMTTPRVRWFRCGLGGSRCGQDPHLIIERATHVECLFDRRKPSHTDVVFSYEHQIDVPAVASALLSADQDVVTDETGAVQAWTGAGRRPLHLTGASEYITASGGVVRASSAGNGSLSEVLAEPFDLPFGMSVYAACRAPDVTNRGASNRLFMLSGQDADVFQCLFPLNDDGVLLATPGGNLSASGLDASALETFAVWGFVLDAQNQSARILRNGSIIASTALSVSLTGIVRRRFLVNAALELKGALLIEQTSTEIDAAATAYLSTQHGIT